MKRLLTTVLIAFAAIPFWFAAPVHPQTPQTLSVPPDSPRWDLEGEAKVAEYLGRKCLYLNGGAAILKDLKMRDAVIDFDMATPAERGFAGIDFRLTDDGANGERFYIR